MAKLAIIAGSGSLPHRVAQEALKKHDIFVIAYEGLADKAMREFNHAEFSLLQINTIIKKLKEEGCKQLVLIGGVARPSTNPGGSLIADIPSKLLEMIQKDMEWQKQNSDDMILSNFVRYLEEVEGFTIKGAEEICPSLTMKAGFLSGRADKSRQDGQRQDAQHQIDIDLGIKVVSAMGNLNVGQSAVVTNGVVVAVEAVEGTDNMLDRVLSLPQAFRGAEDERRGVLVKIPRPHQDLRIDMPTIGLKTLSKVAQANLAGIVVKENNILIDDKDALKAQAKKDGVFIQAVSIK